MHTEIEKIANQILEPVSEAILVEKIAEEILAPINILERKNIKQEV